MIQVLDDFLKDPHALRASALASGFGTWRPRKGDTGLASYEGVNFVGDHATPLRALHERLGTIIPGLVFFRVTNPWVERALVHADREYGCTHTAILYLSPELPCESGTGFYRHKARGWRQMPALADLMRDPAFQSLKADMGNLDAWERYDFVPGIFNRCLVFDSSLIHCRVPSEGFGMGDADSRMTWTAHFNRITA